MQIVKRKFIRNAKVKHKEGWQVRVRKKGGERDMKGDQEKWILGID